MNLKTKKLVARELLYLIVSIIIGFSAFGIGLLKDHFENRIREKELSEIQRIESEYNYLLDEFRKDEKVDSIFNLQMKFHSYYLSIYIHYFGALDEIDTKNYFFWENVRKSISEKTFHFKYAKDEIIEKWLLNYEGYSYKHSDLRQILLSSSIMLDKEPKYDVMGYKEMFQDFALNNDFERYVSKTEWKKYQDLREEHFSLDEKYSKTSPNNDEQFLFYAIISCLGLLFFVRYLAYLLMWIFKTLRVSPNET